MAEPVSIEAEIKDRGVSNPAPAHFQFFGKLYSPAMQLIADILAIFLSFSIQYFIRWESGLIESTLEFNISAFLSGSAIFLAYWLLLFFFSGLYKDWYIRSPFEELFSVIRVLGLGSLLLAFIAFNPAQSVRMLFLLYFLVSSVFMGLGRFAARRLQRKMRARGIISIRSIILGNKVKAAEFYKKTKKYKFWGYDAQGIVLLDTNDSNINGVTSSTGIEVPVLGSSDKLHEIIDSYKPQEIIISTDSPHHTLMLDIVNRCSDKNIKVKIEPNLYDIFTGQARTQNIYGLPLIEISTQLMKPWQEAIKRIFDILLSALILLAGLPFWLLIALAVKLESRGPVFYTQKRMGKNNREFDMYKFRSMVKGADKGDQWTIINDPRVTKVGKFIRKTHLDEIPQFWNVLKGDMSIVGPRPEQPHLVEEFSREIPYYRRRLKVRPGITGWWQVKYQPFVVNKEEIENRLKDDFFYIENMSLKLDVEIVVRTIWCVIKGHGQT